MNSLKQNTLFLWNDRNNTSVLISSPIKKYMAHTWLQKVWVIYIVNITRLMKHKISNQKKLFKAHVIRQTCMVVNMSITTRLFEIKMDVLSQVIVIQNIVAVICKSIFSMTRHLMEKCVFICILEMGVIFTKVIKYSHICLQICSYIIWIMTYIHLQQLLYHLKSITNSFKT